MSSGVRSVSLQNTRWFSCSSQINNPSCTGRTLLNMVNLRLCGPHLDQSLSSLYLFCLSPAECRGRCLVLPDQPTFTLLRTGTEARTSGNIIIFFVGWLICYWTICLNPQHIWSCTSPAPVLHQSFRDLLLHNRTNSQLVSGSELISCSSVFSQEEDL